MVELVAAAAGVLIQAYVWWWTREHDGEWDDPIRLSKTGFVVGAFYRGVTLWLRDRDIGGVRTSRPRRLAFAVCSWQLRRRAFPTAAGFEDGFNTGELAGTVAYRCWYGLLRPLPGVGD